MAYATVADVQARMTNTMSQDQQDICSNLLDDAAVIAAIDPCKDVDAFSAVNVGHIMIGDFTFLPCTPNSIKSLPVSASSLKV